MKKLLLLLLAWRLMMSVFSFLHCGVDSFPFPWSTKAATSAQGSCPPVAWPFLRVRQAQQDGEEASLPPALQIWTRASKLPSHSDQPLPLGAQRTQRPQFLLVSFHFSSSYSAPLPVPRNISANGCPEWGKPLKWGGVDPFSKAPEEAAGKQSRRELRRDFHAVRTIHQWESFCLRMM